ncbi:hypothetical protein QBC46DRAFT_403373 [Diplogelasinospora grovesii]|uniref:Uncharacterized protein n=1 Tax=Diplogelasinospora grovesii TaxID=303347 RepID=A0AAN6NKI9_9PEZI|nr:hypothetical protein QBC46DRAFT_403373 [Diplogelasinospora grovesii]
MGFNQEETEKNIRFSSGMRESTRANAETQNQLRQSLHTSIVAFVTGVPENAIRTIAADTATAGMATANTATVAVIAGLSIPARPSRAYPVLARNASSTYNTGVQQSSSGGIFDSGWSHAFPDVVDPFVALLPAFASLLKDELVGGESCMVASADSTSSKAKSSTPNKIGRPWEGCKSLLENCTANFGPSGSWRTRPTFSDHCWRRKMEAIIKVVEDSHLRRRLFPVLREWFGVNGPRDLSSADLRDEVFWLCVAILTQIPPS